MKNRLLNGSHLSLDQQIELLSEFIMHIDDMPQILDAITELPDAWVGAGVIFQNVWNVMHGFEMNHYIKDIDIFYWDKADLSWQAENIQIKQLKKSLSDVSTVIDLKNIARIHLWYEQRFAISISAYQSVAESIATWPVIGACMAVRKKRDKLEFIAPYGFQDMFSMRVRPNKTLVNKDIYQSKALKWKQQWPLLSIERW